MSNERTMWVPAHARPSLRRYNGSTSLLARLGKIALIATVVSQTGLTPWYTISAQAPVLRPMPGRRTTAPAVGPFDVAARRAVLDTVETLLARHYVDGDTGKLIASHLAERVRAKAYDAINDPYRFAEALTADLRAVNGDKHLVVQYDPTRKAMRPGPEGIRMMGPPPGRGAGTPGPGGPGGPGGRGPSPDMIAGARRNHYELGKVDVLPGNVGYFELRGFSGAPEAEDAIVDALKYLQYTDAMIFDLRRNGGGSAELVNFLISHFTGRDTLASLTVSNRSGGEKFTRYTLAEVPGPRRTDVPVFVLTSGYTASAGEDFAFVLKNLGRAQVIGQATAGAGHNNALLDAGRGFAVSISFTRVADPKTGAEWERIGVQPNVVVDQADALLTAQSLALKSIAARSGADAEQQQLVGGVLEWVEGQLHPRSVAASTLASYAGEYEGGRKMWVVGERLLYSVRPGAPADTLVALSDSTFAKMATRIAFEKAPTGSTQVRITAGGSSLTYSKVK